MAVVGASTWGSCANPVLVVTRGRVQQLVPQVLHMACMRVLFVVPLTVFAGVANKQALLHALGGHVRTHGTTQACLLHGHSCCGVCEMPHGF